MSFPRGYPMAHHSRRLDVTQIWIQHWGQDPNPVSIVRVTPRDIRIKPGWFLVLIKQHNHNSDFSDFCSSGSQKRGNESLWGKETQENSLKIQEVMIQHGKGRDIPIKAEIITCTNAEIIGCPSKLELLGKPGWACANSEILGGKGKWGEDKQNCHTEAWRTCTSGKSHRLYRIRDLQSCGGKWDTLELSGDTEMMTSVREHETRCEDKWNNLLSMSRVNRTKAISDVERWEIRKTKQQAVKGQCRNTAVEICKDKLHKQLSGMTNVQRALPQAHQMHWMCS